MALHDYRYDVSYTNLRQTIGWIGLLMPFAVRLCGWIFEGVGTTGSISAYYYTGMRDVFVVALALVGVLIMFYRTPAKQDTWIGVCAGLAAIGIGLFPMDPTYASEILLKYPDAASAACYRATGILGYHFVFVGIFFSLAFILVFFRFPAFTSAVSTWKKKMRNRIYRICAVVMLGSGVVIGLLAAFNEGASIFWPETTASASFAIAWLVKGQFLLPDPWVDDDARENSEGQAW